ncbi:MAG: polysaccharide deacetylase family protein [Bacteroidota bacterium]
MLNHRVVSITFIVIVLMLIGLGFTYPIHWLWFVIPVILFFSVEFYGAYFVNSGFHIDTICEKQTNEKIVALTFDDGPMPGRTENVLAVLKKFDVKATFFCIGKRIKGNEDILKQIHEHGHLIGNHSFSHSNLFDLMTAKQFINDLQLGNQEIEKVIGKQPLFFRPPYGVTTPGLAKACKGLNYHVIGWNVRSLDTTIKDKQQLVDRVTKRIQPGSIVLFHDTVENIEIALEEILNYLKQNNYRVVELDKLIQKQAYA